MVKGFELFQQRFAPFADSFIIIGGAACDLRLAPYGGFRIIGAMPADIVVDLPEEIKRRMKSFIDLFVPTSVEWDGILASIGSSSTLAPTDYQARFKEIFGL